MPESTTAIVGTLLDGIEVLSLTQPSEIFDSYGQSCVEDHLTSPLVCSAAFGVIASRPPEPLSTSFASCLPVSVTARPLIDENCAEIWLLTSVSASALVSV